MVLRKVQVTGKIKEKLGQEGLQQVTDNLWPVDCQSCGRPLGSETPTLLVDDMIMFATATLHHRACQAPDWNDHTGQVRTSGDFVSWRARVVMMPFVHEGAPDSRPMLLVNPAMEMIVLKQDEQERWSVAPHSSFLAMGLRPPGRELVLDRPLPALAGQVTSAALAVTFKGVTINDGYDAPAEGLYRSRARELGGFLLGITHAIDPETLTVEALHQGLMSGQIVMGWAALR